jgi:ABC-type amino acid transport substrate-binding protein
MTPQLLHSPTRRRWIQLATAGLLAPIGSMAVAAGPAREWRWGYIGNYAPFSWWDKSGQALKGFHVDIGHALVNHWGAVGSVRHGTYAEMLQALRKQEIDAIGNFFTRVPDLVGEFAFTSGLQDFRLMLAQHEDDERTFLTLDEIPIDRLGLLANTTVEDQVLAAMGKGYRKYSQIDKALDDLAQQRLDAVIEESLILEYAIHLRQLPLKTTTPMSAPVRLGMLVLKGQAERVAQINQGLQAIRQDGSAARISERWFGYDVTQRRAAGTYINPLTPD